MLSNYFNLHEENTSVHDAFILLICCDINIYAVMLQKAIMLYFVENINSIYRFINLQIYIQNMRYDTNIFFRKQKENKRKYTFYKKNGHL